MSLGSGAFGRVCLDDDPFVRFAMPSKVRHRRPSAADRSRGRWRADPSGARESCVDLSADMQRVVREQRLGFVATVTPDGRPNLSPKGTTTVWDERHLMFADIASPGTVENLATNPSVEINVVDPILRKGYRFRGSATVHVDDDAYEQGLARLRAAGSSTPRERIRSIVVVEIDEATALVSPAYDDGTAESTVVDRWLRHYQDLHGPLVAD
jgi:hypothetical protein